MITAVAAAILSCGLTAAPDGTASPEGHVAMLNATISDAFVNSLSRREPPASSFVFREEPTHMPEWIVPIQKSSETRSLVARIAYGILGLDIRTGWADRLDTGSYDFTETAKGTCRVKSADQSGQGETK